MVNFNNGAKKHIGAIINSPILLPYVSCYVRSVAKVADLHRERARNGNVSEETLFYAEQYASKLGEGIHIDAIYTEALVEWATREHMSQHYNSIDELAGAIQKHILG